MARKIPRTDLERTLQEILVQHFDHCTTVPFIRCLNSLHAVYSNRCQLDSDDEVRDRATFYVNVLKQKQKALSSAYVLNGKCFYFLVSIIFTNEMSQKV